MEMLSQFLYISPFSAVFLRHGPECHKLLAAKHV